MSKNIQPTLKSTPPIQFQQNLILSNMPLSLEDEKFISTTENEWLSRGAYKASIQGMVSDLRTKALALRAQNYPSFMIRQALTQMVTEFNQKLLPDFHAGNAAFETGIATEQAAHAAFASRLQATTLPKKSPAPPIPSFAPLQNPFVAEAAGNTLTHISLARTAAKMVETTGHVLGGVGRMFCYHPKHPELPREEQCQLLMHEMRQDIVQGLEKSGLKEPVKKVMKKSKEMVDSLGESTTRALEDLGVPKKAAEELGPFHADSMKTLVAAAAPIPAVAVAKMGIQALKGTRQAATPLTLQGSFQTTMPNYSYQWPQENRTFKIVGAEKKELPRGARLIPVQPVLDTSHEVVKLAKRINAHAERRLYFPNVAEMRRLDAYDLHQIWSTNQETLLGIVGREVIPKFGLHAAPAKGVEKLLTERIPRSYGGNFVWAASYRHPVNPVAQLADFFSMTHRIMPFLGEGNTGGIFILDTAHAVRYGKSFAFKENRLLWDTEHHERIFGLMDRKGDGAILAAGRGRKTLIREDALVNTDEYHVYWDRQSYDTVVKGYMLEEHNLYPFVDPFFSYDRNRSILFDRFQRQEFITTALEKLEVFDVSKAPWEKYQKDGRELIRIPREEMLVPLNKIGEVGYYFDSNKPLANRWLNSKANDFLFETDSRSEFGALDLDNLRGIHYLRGSVESNHSDMFVHLKGLKVDPSQFNPEQFTGAIINFARANRAKRLYMEIDPSPQQHMPSPYQRVSQKPHVAQALTDWIQRYLVVYHREQIAPWCLPNIRCPIFEIPLE